MFSYFFSFFNIVFYFFRSNLLAALFRSQFSNSLHVLPPLSSTAGHDAPRCHAARRVDGHFKLLRSGDELIPSEEEAGSEDNDYDDDNASDQNLVFFAFASGSDAARMLLPLARRRFS